MFWGLSQRPHFPLTKEAALARRGFFAPEVTGPKNIARLGQVCTSPGPKSPPRKTLPAYIANLGTARYLMVTDAIWGFLQSGNQFFATGPPVSRVPPAQVATKKAGTMRSP